MSDLILNYSSLNAITGDSQELAIYGFKRAGWEKITDEVVTNGPVHGIQRIYDWNSLSNHNISIKIKNRDFEKINLSFEETNSDETLEQAREKSKMAIVNLVLENYKRKKEGLKVIPLLFVVNSKDARVGQACSLNFRSLAKGKRGAGESRLITESELNICYKLATKFKTISWETLSNTELVNIQEVANETFRFVEVEIDSSDPLKSRFRAVAPFWQSRKWQDEFERDRAGHISIKPRKTKETDWRKQLKNLAIKYISTDLFLQEAKNDLDLSGSSSTACLSVAKAAIQSGSQLFIT